MEFGKIGSGVEQGKHGDASGPGGVLVAMGGQLLMKRAGLAVGTRLGQTRLSLPQGWAAITFPYSVGFLVESRLFLTTRDEEDYCVTCAVWYLFPGFSSSLFPLGPNNGGCGATMSSVNLKPSNCGTSRVEIDSVVQTHTRAAAFHNALAYAICLLASASELYLFNLRRQPTISSNTAERRTGLAGVVGSHHDLTPDRTRSINLKKTLHICQILANCGRGGYRVV